MQNLVLSLVLSCLSIESRYTYFLWLDRPTRLQHVFTSFIDLSLRERERNKEPHFCIYNISHEGFWSIKCWPTPKTFISLYLKKNIYPSLSSIFLSFISLSWGPVVGFYLSISRTVKPMFTGCLLTRGHCQRSDLADSFMHTLRVYRHWAVSKVL